MARPEIRLVLQKTADQLRGDLPLHHADQFGRGGFRYLLDDGIWCSYAHDRHANTETIVGHALLATRTIPALHGRIAYVWLDQDEGALLYHVEEGRYDLPSEGAGVDRSREIDSTQRVARGHGSPPVAILKSTFSDELAARHGLVVAATHGSPWRYDRPVPIAFAGNRIKGMRINRPVTSYGIAVTLSNVLGLEAPSGAIGELPAEVMR
jgi:hypothetical protein